MSGRAAFAFLVLAGVVAVFLIEREEAVEHHDRAGGAQDTVWSPRDVDARTWSSSALSIWLATVRFQISS